VQSVEDTSKVDIDNACSSLKRLRPKQFNGVVANLNMVMPPSPLHVDTTVSNYFIAAQVTFDHVGEELGHCNPAMCVSLTHEHENLSGYFLGIDGFDLFGMSCT
jgi:hypothetical protein